MPRPSAALKSRNTLIIVATLVVVAVIAIAASGRVLESPRPDRAHSATATLTVTQSPLGRPIPSGFVGLSIEYPTLETYAGSDPKAINPALVGLIRNLAPGQSPSLRIGGDTSDWTWYPIPGMQRPLGVRYTLTGRWLEVAHALAQATGPRMILGINLEVNNRRVAVAEQQALSRGIGAGAIGGFEIGNEPELYSHFPWYVLNGRPYYGRPANYDFAGFIRDYGRVASALRGAPLAGPNIGGPEWMPYLRRFLAGQRRVRVATLHRYPLKRCSASVHNTVSQLLANSSARGLANSIARYPKVAHAEHIPLRIDEMNAVSCGGEPGVSNTFASALWSIDALFEMARAGVDGVNIHTRPGSSGELFSFSGPHGGWRARVNPEYYGLMLFAQSAPAGARMLRITGNFPPHLHVWATRASDGHVRVVLINDSPRQRKTITIRLPGGSTSATLERLTAPSLHATGHVTLGGQTLWGSSTGSLPAPRTEALSPRAGRYVITLPAASAALLSS